MDVSKEYIKMCHKAKEVQVLNKQNDVRSYYADCYLDNKDNDKYDTWLPRQDQLQGMVSDNVLTLVDCSYAFLFHGVGGKVYESMEQLWLSFVMLDNYSKTWDGEEWMTK